MKFIRWFAVLASVGCFVGCGGGGPPAPAPGAPVSPAATLCGETDLGDLVGEPQPQPEMSCATGQTIIGVPAASGTWGTLDVILCNISGIPATALDGFICGDPNLATINLTEDGNQVFSRTFVTVQSTDLGPVLNTCTNNGTGNVGTTPNSNIQWNVEQSTADFWYGNEALSNQCSVAFFDTHNQAILVNVGFQFSAYCTNASCTSGSSLQQRAGPLPPLTKSW
jgi:hypothetical protein